MRWKRRAVIAGIGAVAVAVNLATPAAGTTTDRRPAPVTVGFIEQTEGAIVTPEFGTAVEAMVDYFNAELGGVGGRRMEARLCATDDTAASAEACARRFAAADDVHLVIESTTNPTAIADVLAPAGKPLLAGGIELGNMLRPGVFVMEPGTAGTALGLFTYAATDLGVTHMTVFHADDPAVEATIPVIDHITSSVGIEVDAYVPLGFEGDLTGPISEGLQGQSDGVAFIVAPDQCAPAGQALQSLGVDLPVVAAELCLTDDIVGTGAVQDWHAGIQSVAPVADGGREAERIRGILARYGEGAEPGGLAGLGVGYTWIARDVLARAGGPRATDATVMRVLTRYASDDVLGFDEVACPGPGSFVGACNQSILMVQVDGEALYDVGGFVQGDYGILEELLGG
jgi:ABC-type branched-subunit amino acid transport system substrate-binding protein